MTRIVICRHGNTFDKGDVVTRVGARTDLPLSTSGREQAQKLADELSGFSFTKAYCSPLIRTRQTTVAIINPETSLQILDFLTEIDYGIDENKPEAEVVARLGQDLLDLWDLEAIPPKGWEVDPEALIMSWIAFFDEHRDDDSDILVVTSNGIARFALDAIEGTDTSIPRKLRTAAFGQVELSSEKTELLYWDKRARSNTLSYSPPSK